MAQPEIRHATAEQLVRAWEDQTDKDIAGAMHASQQLALLQDRSNVFLCSPCDAVSAGGTLRLLKSQCVGSGESRRKARRKLERGLMLDTQSSGRCEARFFSRDIAGCF